MFIAALSTMAKVWKEAKCPSVDEWIKKMWYIYTYNGALLSNQKRMKSCYLQLCGWNLEGIMLSEIRERQKS